ncbi:bile acid:sodium symporter family protein [Nonomuraea glycinis]|uniref:Transporter n=1 Tax=Nonomuraea glycinis TaxID=2047744 RepID=A0A918AEK1_9ACTN|nr:bile acid:sodium symporter family protein [Nonomuraea glycinis]MCA2183249.1 bile acid:sodium symporter family protein [Nonomuraea glycinis]WSG65494.1 bile acid:sodium symporter family protein [Nonomuraea glycinis]GGP18245.1 transporter [Nonomuraea glycinis]
MQQSVLTTVMLPAALALIMFGLGLSLAPQDFARIATRPKAVVIALVAQLLVLPAVCFGLVVLFGLEPLLAAGMMLLAASPGGTTANLYSHLFGGDVALNVSLTAVNSVLAAFTLPVVVNLSLDYFVGSGPDIGLQADKVVQVFAIVLVPVAIGMIVRRLSARFADRMDKPVRILSAIVLAAVIIGAIVQERERLGGYLASVGLVAVLFSAISLTVGYWLPRLFKVERRQAIASGMEIGIHNSTLAITIALSPSLLANSTMAVPPAVYGVLMFGTTLVFGYLVRRRVTEPDDRLPAAG